MEKRKLYLLIAKALDDVNNSLAHLRSIWEDNEEAEEILNNDEYPFAGDLGDNCIFSDYAETCLKLLIEREEKRFKVLNKYEYKLSTGTIWGSFDHGEVIAENEEEAIKKAKKELTENLEKINLAMKHCDITSGFVLDMNIDSLEFEFIGVSSVEGKGKTVKKLNRLVKALNTERIPFTLIREQEQFRINIDNSPTVYFIINSKGYFTYDSISITIMDIKKFAQEHK